MSTTNSSSPIAQFMSSVFYDRWPGYTDKLDSDVLVSSPNIIRRIIQLVESTELHTAINYLALRFMIQVSAFIPNTGLAQVFYTFLTARPTMTSPRWKICLRAVEQALAPLMYASYFTYQNLHASSSQFADFVGEAAQEFLRGVDDSSYFTAFSKAAFRDVLSKTHFRVLGPPWVSESSAMEAYIQTLPAIRPAHTALQSYTAVYEASFLYSLSRGFSQQWTRSIFATECWHELNPRTLYVPLLTFNETLWSHPDTQSLQVSRAGFRVQECILEMLLGHTAFANDHLQWWLDEATKHKLESSEACLNRIAGRGNIREPLAIVKRSLSVRLAYEQFQRSVNASGSGLTLSLPNGKLLTAKQLFFVLLVLQSCESRPAEDAAPSSELEWNAALGNDPELSVAFGCPRGSTMNPARKCGV
ncbi:membrane metallo-endopeptidase-like 1 [Rhipicephalus microplus]|uniref:membrane metallo-endopeptidase-like 1 n=1 Tax=Rhipicephalus microplus TaxID=6941 RepID=UPI003F6D6366